MKYEFVLTEQMEKDRKNCGEDSRCLECSCHMGEDDCVFNHLYVTAEQDAISRKDTLKAIIKHLGIRSEKYLLEAERSIYKVIQKMPSINPQPKWIPTSERLPENLEPVNITWVNHNPESYYADIKDKPYTATGHYCKGRWYWYSSTCQDYLKEYGRCDVDEIDTDIEVTAWMPIPEPYKAESETQK